MTIPFHGLVRAAALAAATLVLALCAPLASGATYGYGDQNTQMFTDPRWIALPLKDVRRTVEWDTAGDPIKVAQLDTWMDAAKTAGARPLLAIEHSYTAGRTLSKPTVAQYTALVKWLRQRYPTWKTLTPWNEANFRLQPTAKNPALAFKYWQAAKKACKGCTVTSPVILTSGTGVNSKFLPAFAKLAKGKITLWAVHMYGDNNRFTDKSLKPFEKAVKGQIWITEAAGWVKFLDTGSFPYNEARAAKAIGSIFATAKKHPRIKRVYFYQWLGDTDKTARWDSGILNADGTPRLGYAALLKGLKR